MSTFPKLGPAGPPPPPAPRAARPDSGAAGGEGARDYLFLGVAAVLVVGFVLLARSGGNPLVMLAVVPALAALLIRATVLPAVFLALVVYLAVYPGGVPYVPVARVGVVASSFRVVDFVFVAAVGVYFVAYFRLASFKYRVLAATAAVPAAPAVPLTRQGDGAGGDEYARALAQVLGLTFAAAVAWPVVNALAVEPLRVPPFRVDLGGNDGQSRFLVLAGAVGFGGLAVGSLVGYWAAAGVRPGVARQYFLDLAWREGRRELNRREKWRAWGRGQLAREPFRLPVRAVLRVAAFLLLVLLAFALGLALLGVVLGRVSIG